MAKKQKKPAKARGARKVAAKSKAKPAPKPRKQAASEGERELHYTDLRKVTLANALKRLR